MENKLRGKILVGSALLLSSMVFASFSQNKLAYADEVSIKENIDIKNNENIQINEEDLDKELSDSELKIMFPDENLREVIVRTATYTIYSNPQDIPDIKSNKITLRKLQSIKYLLATEEGIESIQGIS
ncbi:hypothetical protein, partial [Clostridium perfringens]